MVLPLPAHAPFTPKYKNADHFQPLWLIAADTSAGRVQRQLQKRMKNVAVTRNFVLILR